MTFTAANLLIERIAMSTHPAPALVFSVLNRRVSASTTQRISPPRQAAVVPTKPLLTAEDRDAIRVGAAQERARWIAVVKSAAFSAQPAVGAHLLASTEQPASEIIALLRRVSADAETARMTSPAAINARWQAAFKRADAGPR